MLLQIWTGSAAGILHVCVCICTCQVLKVDDLKLLQLHKVLSEGYHNLLLLLQA